MNVRVDAYALKEGIELASKYSLDSNQHTKGAVDNFLVRTCDSHWVLGGSASKSRPTHIEPNIANSSESRALFELFKEVIVDS